MKDLFNTYKRILSIEELKTTHQLFKNLSKNNHPAEKKDISAAEQSVEKFILDTEQIGFLEKKFDRIPYLKLKDLLQKLIESFPKALNTQDPTPLISVKQRAHLFRYIIEG